MFQQKDQSICTCIDLFVIIHQRVSMCAPNIASSKPHSLRAWYQKKQIIKGHVSHLLH